MKFSATENFAKLPLPSTEKWPLGVFDVETFRHGSMSLIFFAPQIKDFQTCHDQDELYFVLDGSGILQIESDNFPFSKGDALFVKAGAQHRFLEFSADIKMWAVFWGKQGGEAD